MHQYELEEIEGDNLQEKARQLAQKLQDTIWHECKAFLIRDDKQAILFLNNSLSSDPVRFQEYTIARLTAEIDRRTLQYKAIDSLTLRQNSNQALKNRIAFILSLFDSSHEIHPYYTKLPTETIQIYNRHAILEIQGKDLNAKIRTLARKLKQTKAYLSTGFIIRDKNEILLLLSQADYQPEPRFLYYDVIKITREDENNLHGLLLASLDPDVLDDLKPEALRTRILDLFSDKDERLKSPQHLIPRLIHTSI